MKMKFACAIKHAKKFTPATHTFSLSLWAKPQVFPKPRNGPAPAPSETRPLRVPPPQSHLYLAVSLRQLGVLVSDQLLQLHHQLLQVGEPLRRLLRRLPAGGL